MCPAACPAQAIVDDLHGLQQCRDLGVGAVHVGESDDAVDAVPLDLFGGRGGGRCGDTGASCSKQRECKTRKDCGGLL